ncbi:MAG TPA: glycine cleavage system protein GcvH [Deltaproteobacteria bacterium]|nr:glycine cleavage system protein GcvH [Deltaproteobacteria bacterium]|tara:strand:+ start:131 stop:523 length:393 start_codon:yes stop_codon:yes gene_type:complete
MSQTPSDLKYTREHEWIRLDGNQAEIGITFHAQKSLGDIVYVELPSVGDELEAGEEFGTIESVKAVSSLFSPMSGKVTDINSELADRPETINEDCYDEGWLIRVALSEPDEQDNLLDDEEYDQFVLEETD